MTLPSSSALVAWLIWHAAWLLARYQPGRETGHTPYSRVWGRPYGGRLVSFGETVYALAPENYHGTGAFSKWASRWRLGVWLGKDERCDDHIVLVDGELKKFRCVRRLGVGHPKRWDKEALLAVTTTPWGQAGRADRA